MKINVRVLGRPADERMIGGKGPLPMSMHKVIVDHGSQVSGGQLFERGLGQVAEPAEQVELERRNADRPNSEMP